MAEDTGKSKRRPVKKAETVREKTEKATLEGSKQPRRLQVTKRRAGAPFRAVGKASSKLGRFKVLRIIGLILAPPYFRNSWKELRHVTWPKPKDSFRLTGAVIVFTIAFGLIVFVLDFVLDKVFKEVLLK